jgi:hypothetical protein
MVTAIRTLGVGVALLLAGDVSAQTVAPARAEQARPLLSEASRLARGLAARSVHLSLIADLQAVAGDVDGARETARAMGDPSRSAALRVAGIAQAKVGDVAGALATAQSITREHHRDAVLAAVAVAQALNGDMSAAHATLRSLTSGQHLVLAEIAKAQAGRGDVQAALLTVQRIGTWGDGARSAASRALIEVAAAQARVGDATAADASFARAAKLAASLAKGPTLKTGASPQASVLEAIAVAQARLGLTVAALRTTDRIALGEFRVDALIAVARTLHEIRREDARGVLTRAIDLARGLDAGVARDIALERVAKAALAFGDLDATRALAPVPGLPGIRVTILTELAVVEATVAGLQTARTTLARAVATADTMPADYRKGFASAEIARAAARIGDVELAVKEGRSLDLEPDRAFAVVNAAQAHIVAGDVDGGLATLAELPGPARASALAGLVVAWVKNGRVDLASRLLRELDVANAEAYARAVRAVAAARAERGDVDMVATLSQLSMPLPVRVAALVGTAAGLLGRTTSVLDDP